MRRLSKLPTWLAFVCFVVGMMASQMAFAHPPGLSRGQYQLSGKALVVQLVFSNTELAGLLTKQDQDQNGKLSLSEIQAAKTALQEKIANKVVLRSNSDLCTLLLGPASLLEEDGIAVSMNATCPSVPKKLHVELPFLKDLSHGHRHLFLFTSGPQTFETVVFQGTPEIDVDVQEGSAFQPSPKAIQTSTGPNFGGMFRLGIEHILTGYDHLIFLFGLLLLGGRFRSLITVITAFTLAHSLTLGLAILGVWAPKPSLVEPAIALSIAYVGIENFWIKSSEKRWRITFPFGLIHGFGFAGALGEISLPKAQIPKALLAFNLGVESGQVAVLAIVLPLVLWLHRYGWFNTKAVPVLNVAIVTAGVFWFVQRVFF
jgi:hydrogenase/urease accessory protein HupE